MKKVGLHFCPLFFSLQLEFGGRNVFRKKVNEKETTNNKPLFKNLILKKKIITVKKHYYCS